MSLRDRLIREEGWKNQTYADTLGNHTWGVGHLDPHSPIGEYHSDDRVSNQLDADISAATGALERCLPWSAGLSPARLGVLIDMAFNMGVGKLLGFHDTLAAVEQGRYTDAAAAMLNSTWARQVGDRATTLSHIMATGIDQ
jgi:lysozyme